MFDLGIQELIVIFVVALLVFGPKKLPELAQNMGKGVAHLKKALFDIKQEINKEAGMDVTQAASEFPEWKKHALEQIYGKEGFPTPGGTQQGVNPAGPESAEDQDQPPQADFKRQETVAPTEHAGAEIEGADAGEGANPPGADKGDSGGGESRPS